MFEFQLLKIQREMPMLLKIIESTIQSVYRETEEVTRTMRSDPLAGKRTGYYLYWRTEHDVRRSVEEAGIEGVEVKAVKSGTGSYHLEIITPYAVLMVSHVHRNGDVPKKANYRQKYVDQTFVQEIFPELSPFTPECSPLYIITHSSVTNSVSKAVIRIGRLSVDQSSWSCNFYLNDLIAKANTTEEIVPNNTITVPENVQRKSRIRIKKS